MLYKKKIIIFLKLKNINILLLFLFLCSSLKNPEFLFNPDKTENIAKNKFKNFYIINSSYTKNNKNSYIIFLNLSQKNFKISVRFY